MSRFRMCRWHITKTKDCTNPDYENIDCGDLKVPRCKTCGKSPPIKELVPQLSAEWPPNPLPPDGKIGELNLYWPESVFGRKDAAVRSSTSFTYKKQDKETVQVEVEGKSESFDLVDEEPLDSSHVRLMRLLPIIDEGPVCVSLETYEDNNIPEYEAMSYSLGGQNRSRLPNKPIYIGRLRDIMVLTETCESMLRFLSPQADERSAWFWFDYLCINQHDMAERDSQLPKMGSIYGLCTRVIVYLGDDIVQRLGRGERRSRHWMHEIDETLKLTGKITPLTLEDILDRGYFKRTWIIQEVLLAETVIIPIEKCDFRAGLVALNRLGNARQWNWEETGAPWLQQMGQTSMYGRNLYEALRQTWKSEVTDPRDRVFGILGLVQDDPEFKPNSSLSWLDTFIGTCAHLIKRGHTELLLKSMGTRAPVMELSWLPEKADPNIWERLDTSNYNQYIDNPICRDDVSGVDEGSGVDEESGVISRRRTPFSHRIDVICERPRWRKQLPLVPKFDQVSLCKSSGALRLKLSHLLTLAKIPIQLDEGGTVKAFKICEEESFLIVATLNGPLDTLQVSDEIFLHVGAHNESGILFALRQSQKDRHRLLFSCACLAVWLYTDENSLRKDCIHGVPIYPRNDEHQSSEYYKSTFGRNLSSILQECSEINSISFRKAIWEEDPILNWFDRESGNAIVVSAYTPIPDQNYKIKYEMKICDADTLAMSQGILDDDLESNNEQKKMTHFLTALQKTLQDSTVGCTITVEDEKLVLRDLPPNFEISVGRGGVTDNYCFRNDFVWRKPLISGRHEGVLALSWRPEKFEIHPESVESAIRGHNGKYLQLRNLTGFRRQKGLKEIELLKQCKEHKSENDSVYPDIEWPCVEGVVRGLGLVGTMRDIQIH